MIAKVTLAYLNSQCERNISLYLHRPQLPFSNTLPATGDALEVRALEAWWHLHWHMILREAGCWSERFHREGILGDLRGPTK